MKYYLTFILSFITGAFIFTSCNSLLSSSKTPRLYVCMSALTPLGGIEVDTSSSQIKDSGNSLTLTTDEGNQIIIPKSLCVEVIRADS